MKFEEELITAKKYGTGSSANGYVILGFSIKDMEQFENALIYFGKALKYSDDLDLKKILLTTL